MNIRSSQSRLIRTFGAQIYNQTITVGVQLALVPILLHFWGPERYGVWLLLSAIPTYLTFADFGFTLSAKNEMTIKVSKGDREGAISVYQSVFILLCATASIVTVVGTATLLIAPLHSIISLGSTSERSARILLGLLCVNVLLNQYTLLFAGGFRSAGKPAEEVIWTASGRLAEGFAIAASAGLGGDVVVAGAAIVISRLTLNALTFLRLRYTENWLVLGSSRATSIEVRKLLNPSISFMTQTLAQALTIQGPILVLGAMQSPLLVLAFSTTRTLCRLGTTGTNFLNATFLPEYSRLYAESAQFFYKLARAHFALITFFISIYVFTIAAYADKVMDTWTHGTVTIDHSWFLIMVAAVTAEMIWTSLFIPICSINKHIFSAYAYVAITIISIGSMLYFTGSYGITAIAWSLLFCHAFMIAILAYDLTKKLHMVSRR